MIRLSWQRDIGGTNQLNSDLTPRSTIALKLRTVNQDRSWGRLPSILASDNYEKIPAGGQDARGWPFLALWCEVDEGVPSGYTTRGGIALSPASSTIGAARILPYFPIWRGLVYDTLIYAAAWLAAIISFRRVRAIVRARSGLCPRCAYDRHGGPAGPCPECGRSVPSKPTTVPERARNSVTGQPSGAQLRADPSPRSGLVTNDSSSSGTHNAA